MVSLIRNLRQFIHDVIRRREMAALRKLDPFDDED